MTLRRRPINRSNTAHDFLQKAVVTCIVVTFLLQISLHSSLDKKHLLRTSSSNLGRTQELLTNANRKAQQRAAPLHNQHDPIHYEFSKSIAEEALVKHGRDVIFQPLRAYIEKPLNDTVPNTVDTGNLDNKRPKVEVGRPGKWYVPLPLREGTPEDLRVFEYGHKLKSCNDLPGKLPIDRGYGHHVTDNVNNRLTFASGELDKWDEAKEGCPVNADPFLPWLHDVFPDRTGSKVHFIAQNKRLCNSGKEHIKDILELQPQVTIMQPVSIQRVDEATAQQLAPELWSDGTADNQRYRLAPHEESDPDALFTRFICRFRAMDYTQTPPKLVNVGETVSTYPYNYEFVNYRKNYVHDPENDLSMLTPKGKDNAMFWFSQLSFECPVPENGDLRSAIASGDSVLSDGTPSVYVDLVPIRTAPRYGKSMSYFTPDMAGDTLYPFIDRFGFNNLTKSNILKTGDSVGSDNADNHPERLMHNGFDPWLFWGKRHVLPRIEASGRYENLPVCLNPSSGGVGSKMHKLTACLWASATFTTRGNAEKVTNAQSRIMEWIEFHLMIGFDHIYVYDNTGAHTDELSLESSLYPRFLKSEVTYIDWPSQVCNNNIPAHENTGERSSQYAAENSCRTRYGPFTEWMASFDTDEYLIPMGSYNSMVQVVDNAKKEGTQILSFKSTRAVPLVSFMEPFHEHEKCGEQSDPKCLKVKDDVLFVEAYNCEFEEPPKPDWAKRAQKQIFRPEFMLAHYVHYHTVTPELILTKNEALKSNRSWSQFFNESIKEERFTDDINEAVMLHTKTVLPEKTVGWKKQCEIGAEHIKKNCFVGFPSGNAEMTNCFTNQKLNDIWIPQLRTNMRDRDKKEQE